MSTKITMDCLAPHRALAAMSMERNNQLRAMLDDAIYKGPPPKHTTADCAGCGAPLQRMARVCAYCAREH